jgi:hypothetical protein
VSLIVKQRLEREGGVRTVICDQDSHVPGARK